MVILLQIYDTGQQESILREFGQHMTNSFSWGLKRKGGGQDTYTMEQRRAWVHHDGMEFLSPLIMFPLQIRNGGSIGEQQTFLLLRWYLDVAGVGGGTSIVQGDFSLILDAQATPSSWEGL